MKAWRYGLIGAGLVVLAYGAARLVVQVPGSLLGLLLWMTGAAAVHDATLALLVVALGWVLARLVPARARFLQSALIIGGLITIIALPMIHRLGRRPRARRCCCRTTPATWPSSWPLSSPGT